MPTAPCTTPAVEAALRSVPRHLFLPDVPLNQAYADDVVSTKQAASGESISAASQPTIVATMLEQLQAQPGETILEIGAGTGYNASLLATLVGDKGRIVTVDVDDDIVEKARRGLDAACITNVEVILGDGAAGHESRAPYDRIIATVGAWDMPRAWTQQLAPTGRLVVPLRIRGAVTRSIAFEGHGALLRSTSSSMAGFMPLRDGAANDPRRYIELTPDASVILQTHQDQGIEPLNLIGVLDTPGQQAWSEVTFAGDEPFEWIDLWLTCTLRQAWSRMTATEQAKNAGIVWPQFHWGAWATTDKNNLAYLTLRPIPRADASPSRFEVGVIGHGPDAAEVASRVVDQLRTWDHHYRGHDVRFEIAPADQQLTGQFVFPQPHNQLAITWH